MPSLAGRLGVLREPNYRRLFFGRTISLVGDGMAPVAIAFAILDLTRSATDLGIVLAAHSLLITALVLVGGVFVRSASQPSSRTIKGRAGHMPGPDTTVAALPRQRLVWTIRGTAVL